MLTGGAGTLSARSPPPLRCATESFPARTPRDRSRDRARPRAETSLPPPLRRHWHPLPPPTPRQDGPASATLPLKLCTGLGPSETHTHRTQSATERFSSCPPSGLRGPRVAFPALSCSSLASAMPLPGASSSAEADAAGAPPVHQGRFRGVLLGGTFDRLHGGHQSLLATAVSCCSVENGDFLSDSAQHIPCLHPLPTQNGPQVDERQQQQTESGPQLTQGQQQQTQNGPQAAPERQRSQGSAQAPQENGTQQRESAGGRGGERAPQCRLIVGISEGPLLANKFLKELIQPYDERAAAVLRFLEAEAARQGKAGGIAFKCVPIVTAAPEQGCTDPSLDCIVLSEETLKGGALLNSTRQANGLHALEVVVAPTVLRREGETEKLSSSDLRREALGTLLRPLWVCQRGGQPEAVARKHRRRPRGHGISCPPYLIGLTGGIACGKSTVSQQLRALGAASVDCDRLAHKAYEPGTPTHRRLVQIFGDPILLPDGSIDRRALGAIVFKDPQRMADLTACVWPAVRRLVAEEQEHLASTPRAEGTGSVTVTGTGTGTANGNATGTANGSDSATITIADAPATAGAEVLLVEAAMMLEAGTQETVDELWVVFAPDGVARRRLMERNGVSEADAQARMDAQISSTERVSAADVAIFNGWGQEDTRALTSKAWSQLQRRIQGQLSQWRTLVALRQPPQVWVRWLYAASGLGLTSGESAAQWFDRLYGGEGSGGPRALGWALRLLAAYHGRAHFLEDPAAVKLAIHFAAAVLSVHPVAHPGDTRKGGVAPLGGAIWNPAAAEAACALLDELCAAGGGLEGSPGVEAARGVLRDPRSAIKVLVEEAVRDQPGAGMQH